ncbi:Helix-turn-helix, partial [Hydrogenoanaerobacterium saccharovorans]
IEKSRECYNQYENGKRKMSINDLCKIADEFNVPLDWFTGRNIEIMKHIKNQ